MSDLAVRVEGALTEEQVDLVKQTIAKEATDQELNLFLYQCKRTGLDPLSKQIYLVKRWDSKAKRNAMAIQTGIDGYRLIADRTGKYAGNDDPVFGEMWEWNTDDRKTFQAPVSASVTVYKMVGNQRCPFTATARWNEYYPGDKQGFMWRTKPHVMLGKCAEALALRKAFPAELSGVYTDAEMEQAGGTPIEAAVVQEPPAGASHTVPKSESEGADDVATAAAEAPQAEGDAARQPSPSASPPWYGEWVSTYGPDAFCRAASHFSLTGATVTDPKQTANATPEQQEAIRTALKDADWGAPEKASA